MAHEYWRCLLDIASEGGGPQPGSDLQAEVIDFLMKNEFDGLQQLRFAEKPQRWIGAEFVSDDALSFIEDWRNEVKLMADMR